MNYTLTKATDGQESHQGLLAALKDLAPLMAPEKGRLGLATIAILINSSLTILAPIVLGHAVDNFLSTKNYSGVWRASGVLLLLYLGAAAGAFLQTRIMGKVGQNILFRLRGLVFTKLQELPVSFFTQNKAGDLISRINNDTNKLNDFFSRSLMQFVGNVFVIIGAAIAMLLVNFHLGAAALVPAVVLLVFAWLCAGWIKRSNFKALQTLGALSSEVQESLENFRVIIAFNRRDYFRERFLKANTTNYRASLIAGIANSTYLPVFGLASNLGALIVLVYGLYLIGLGLFSLGLLISYLVYVTRFYDPLRQIASLFSDLQSALAGWDRITEILEKQTDLLQLPEDGQAAPGAPVMEFRDVSFAYPGGSDVLSEVNFSLEAGKTYALVGPTGGGKTTTASLMARLFDAGSGQILLQGRDIRSISAAERAASIGFILQDPFLFGGTVGENILYGNPLYEGRSGADAAAILREEQLEQLMSRFDEGVDTPVVGSGETLSLGQKQLIAFMRAVLRKPDLLILDEATANIDTVTEELLEEILQRLPAKTTRVIIAHRLNTIENADQIYFVNGGGVVLAGSMQEAIDLLEYRTRTS